MRVGVAFVVLAMSGLALSCAAPGTRLATAQAASTGDWQITQETDSVTGGKLVSIVIYSAKLSHAGTYFARSVMQFACLKSQPQVQFVFGFQIGSKADSEFAYRFDEQPVHALDMHILRGQKVAVIEDKKEVAKFLKDIVSANVLDVVINSVVRGPTSAEFRVTGAQAAVDMIAAGCHPATH